MANTVAKIVWVSHLLRELHALPPGCPTLLYDNISALFLGQNPILHKWEKHIDIDYHFVVNLLRLETTYLICSHTFSIS